MIYSSGVLISLGGNDCKSLELPHDHPGTNKLKDKSRAAGASPFVCIGP